MTMARHFVIPALLILLLTGAAGPSLTSTIEAQAPAVGFAVDRLGRVEDFVAREVEARRLPGAVVLPARGGRIATLRAFGEGDVGQGRRMQTDSLFRMASATKIVTAIGLLTLYDEGRFALGDPAAPTCRPSVSCKWQTEIARARRPARSRSAICCGTRPGSGTATMRRSEPPIRRVV